MKRLFPAALTLILLTGAAWAEGDAAKGAKVFKKCASCHAVEEGKNKLGPTLFGVVGREAGAVEGFKYSKGLVSAGIVWDEASLTHFLKSPKKFIKGTKMAFAGIRKEKDMSNLLAYLNTLK